MRATLWFNFIAYDWDTEKRKIDSIESQFNETIKTTSVINLFNLSRLCVWHTSISCYSFILFSNRHKKVTPMDSAIERVHPPHHSMLCQHKIYKSDCNNVLYKNGLSIGWDVTNCCHVNRNAEKCARQSKQVNRSKLAIFF